MRARVVLYNQKVDKVLLIHRTKYGRDYWVVPGGGSKGRESPQETAVREIHEELGIELVSTNLEYLFTKTDQIEEQVFFCEQIPYIAAPKIGGEEKKRQNSDNLYFPSWIAVDDLLKVNLLPTAIGRAILTAIKINNNKG
ncbi:NUDIX domain-containing protein [Lactobacillus sp. ESL0228]|uniref:NUDIX domain-containing protein n=1 Tax=Lactobacillus sp. ESL0228 TaxID=2069352 RepID=UPI000EFD563F|nr:NUDIX domain-containing protein [Lactobacillus sp. ESL0228]RMC47222.1 NUDIX domain-containing protein [Lactobacillus sp. ESL0228]